MDNPVVKKYGQEKRWVTYHLIERGGKITKVPYQTSGKLASSTDSSTWTTYETISSLNLPAGIVFTADQTLVGVDIDHCINKETNQIEHEQKEIIEKFINTANTYTEVSVSGTGLHLLFETSEPFIPEANRKAPYEIYSKGRYFTFSAQSYQTNRDIRTVSTDELNKTLSILGYPWKNIINPKKEITIPTNLLEKIFASKNGKKIKALYDGDISAYNNDDSLADAALCSHLAFWTAKDAQQMEDIWINSPLGQRKKTQDRMDYRNRTIQFAISACSSVYDSTPQIKNSFVELDLLFSINEKKEKVYIQNTENMSRIISKHSNFVNRFRYDEFKNVYEIKPTKTNIWRTFEDNDAINIQTGISVLFPMFTKVGKEMVKDALIKVMHENVVDSAADYIRALVWDKTDRINDWLHHTYGVPQDKYHTAVASNWVKGLIKRIIEPGCKFDFVLVLEGPQGTKKSTSLSILGGPQNWHVETTMGADSKDFFMQFAGKTIVEFSEGESLTRTEVKRLKAVITTPTDKYRAPYAATSKDFPRRCVFAMTTNQEEYLKDETGNRRWLPITVRLPESNIEWLKDNREQIFAEAYHRLTIGKEKIHEFPKEETLIEQEKRRIQDPNTDAVVEWYHTKITAGDRKFGISASEVYKEVYCGGNITKPIDRYHEMLITSILKNVLKLTKKRKMINGFQGMRWFDESPKGLAEKEHILFEEKDLTPEEAEVNDLMSRKIW